MRHVHFRARPKYARRNWWLDCWTPLYWRTYTHIHQLEVHPWWRVA